LDGVESENPTRPGRERGKRAVESARSTSHCVYGKKAHSREGREKKRKKCSPVFRDLNLLEARRVKLINGIKKRE